MTELKRVTLRVQVTVEANVGRRELEEEITRHLNYHMMHGVAVDAYSRVTQEDPAHS